MADGASRAIDVIKPLPAFGVNPPSGAIGWLLLGEPPTAL
jgi:hypothetical protein